jgi:hypothetical protein
MLQQRRIAAGSGLGTSLGTTIRYVRRIASDGAGNGLGFFREVQKVKLFTLRQKDINKILDEALRCHNEEAARLSAARKTENFRIETCSPAPRCSGLNRPYYENGLVKPPRRDTRALSPAGMFGEKAPLRLASQKNIPRAPFEPMGSTAA